MNLRSKSAAITGRMMIDGGCCPSSQGRGEGGLKEEGYFVGDLLALGNLDVRTKTVTESGQSNEIEREWVIFLGLLATARIRLFVI